MKLHFPLFFALSAAAPVGAAENWFGEPFEHVHASASGTPILHSFDVEPALTGRDLFLTYHFHKGDADEHEFEAELEWAFTRRLGVILELPYILEDDGGETHDGLGDLAIVPRATVVERDGFLLTAQVEIVTPTGSGDFGGETALAPGLAAWFDLGGGWSLNSQFGVEHVFDEDETALEYGFGLVRPLRDALALHLEVTGDVALDGEAQGDASAAGLVGLSYGLGHGFGLRLGYQFPLTSPRDFDSGLAAGMVWHF